MFRHAGKGRTYKQNLKLAAALSFIAGMVNISGVLSLQTLTTNVTGHVAFFAEDVEQRQYGQAVVYLIYIFAYFFGSFASSFSTHLAISRGIHVGPMLAEAAILLAMGVLGDFLLGHDVSGVTIAVLLLFAMGMQNALVTHVSKSLVRTTHLTGLFTDLGIEVAQLFFYRKEEQREKLNRGINLKLAIISFFFVGCIIGGYMHRILLLGTLAVASSLLIIAMVYDALKLNYYRLARKRQRL